MKNLSKFISVVALSGVMSATSVFAATAPGYVDFGVFKTSAGHEFVEVDLDRGLLKIASIFAQKQDAEVARLISGIERLRVNVIGFDDEGRASTLERIENIRTALDAQNWKRMVTVREKSDGDNVAVFVKLGDDDMIQGVTVTVIDHKNEAVLVNVVGQIDPAQLASLGERLDIAPLRELKLAASNQRL